MKEVYVVKSHRTTFYDHEEVDIELVTTDREKARQKELEIDGRKKDWGSTTTMELVE